MRPGLVDHLPALEGARVCLTDRDGEFAYFWQGDVTHAVFHVATLMPIDEDDPQCVNKRLHIGNDHVTIVFNEGGGEFQREWLASAVNYVYLIVQPFGDDAYHISVSIKDGVESVFSVMNDRIVSRHAAGLYCRQLAIHANLACGVHRKLSGNWVERLRLLRRIRDDFGGAEAPSTADFAAFA